MLSIQAMRGLPHLRAPGIVPSIIYFSRQGDRLISIKWYLVSWLVTDMSWQISVSEKTPRLLYWLIVIVV